MSFYGNAVNNFMAAQTKINNSNKETIDHLLAISRSLGDTIDALQRQIDSLERRLDSAGTMVWPDS